ncbi:WD40 repeat-like protein [Plenodomus tracheiphilus IPT5]|uniref:WD40 repeat-like protein n=1 Tax=Plenodomus tracheiphilus IPT5 TaxID=1408161 RepID=A0A6A7AYU1_9PLEO|nr:WD40 repeat-like protein [Plenodomus tracheiphilus IPT5]
MVYATDIENGSSLGILRGHSNTITSMAFSADMSLLVSASNEKTPRLWDLTDLGCVAVLEDHEDVVDIVTFSPDGKLIASASKDTTVRLWDVDSAKCCHIFETPSSPDIRSLEFSPGCSYLTTNRGHLFIPEGGRKLSHVDEKQPVNVFVEEEWIFLNSEPATLIPYKFRAEYVEVVDDIVFFGTSSGVSTTLRVDSTESAMCQELDLVGYHPDSDANSIASDT